MNSRFGVWLGAAALAAAVTMGVDSTARPAAQVDLFAAGPVVASQDRLAAAAGAGVDAAVAALGPERSAGMVSQRPGEAAAAGDVRQQILRQVAVEAIGSDRVRIRVASADVDGATTVARAVSGALVEQGFGERLRIESRTTGGRIVLLARLLALLVLGGLAVRVAVAVVRRIADGTAGATAAAPR